MLNFFKQNLKLTSATLISLYAFYLRFVRLRDRDMWSDEWHQFKHILGEKTLKPFWMPQNYGDHTSFPGEYIINFPVVQAFGYDKWALAIPHAIFTIIGFFFLYKLCQRYLKTTFGYIITFLLVCFNSNLVYHSLEFRPYAVLPTLSVMCLYLMHCVFDNYDLMSLGKKVFIGILFFFVVSYHIYGIVIYFACLSYVFLFTWIGGMLKGINKRMWDYFITLSIFSCLIWLWYSSSLYLYVIVKQLKQTNHETFQFIPNPMTNLIGFTKSVLANLVGYTKFYFMMLGLPLGLILSKDRFKQVVFFIVLIIFPISLICIMDILKNYWFLQRQFVWCMPLFALLLAWGWEETLIFVQKLNQSRK